MRMDRYEDLKENDSLKTRTNKNQELYTDVYMNNVYLDIDNLKNVMENEEGISKDSENLKLIRENKMVDYTYEDKEYNINNLIEEAIKNKDDNVKRSLDSKVDDLEIDNLIESIQENKVKDEKDTENNEDLENNDLLDDLVTGNGDTIVGVPLAEPIKTTNEDNLKHDEIEQEDIEKEETQLEETLVNENDIELDDSFLDKNKKKKIIITIILIIVLLALAFGFLVYKKIIKL